VLFVLRLLTTFSVCAKINGSKISNLKYCDTNSELNIDKSNASQYDIVSGEFTRIPTDTKELTPEQRAEVDKILDKLDEDDDVTNVYHNIKED
jgi:transcriptional/translational regulatory protein YebC/TACO1